MRRGTTVQRGKKRRSANGIWGRSGAKFEVSQVAELLEALVCTGQEPQVAQVVLPVLREAVSECLGRLVDGLEGCYSSAMGSVTDVDHQALKTELALCKALGKILEIPAARAVCSSDRQSECVAALTQTIMRNPSEHDVQVNAQWALAHAVGILATLEIVKPSFKSPTVVRAFLWTAAEAKESLDWESQRMLAHSALQKVADHGATTPADAETQQRCFELLGSRLAADALAAAAPPNPTDLPARQAAAADSVEALACGMARWAALASTGNERRVAAAKAAEALWQVCRGSGSVASRNDFALEKLRALEDSQHLIEGVLRRLPPKAAQGSMASHLLGLLACVYGLPRLSALLSDSPLSSYPAVLEAIPVQEELRWAALGAMKGIEDFSAFDAVEAVHRILALVGSPPYSCLLRVETAVKVLAVLMEGMQSQLQPGLPCQGITAALRRSAESILGFIAPFQEAKEGRWPTKSARALRAAALADAQSRDALARSEFLLGAVHMRIEYACQRHDKNTYVELESTFALVLTLWGVERVLAILQDFLDRRQSLHTTACQELLQTACRIFAGIEDELNAQDAVAILRALLKAKKCLSEEHELGAKTCGAMATAIGHSLGALGPTIAAAPCNDLQEIDLGARALASIIDFIADVDDIGIYFEVCWGVCQAVGTGTLSAKLIAAGLPPRLEALGDKLLIWATSQSNVKTDAASALTEVLEALGRLHGGSFIPALKALRNCKALPAVQTACFRAIANLLDAGAVPEFSEAAAMAAFCREATAGPALAAQDVAGLDERVRTAAERVLGLLCA